MDLRGGIQFEDDVRVIKGVLEEWTSESVYHWSKK
jgi:hypothetical protein